MNLLNEQTYNIRIVQFFQIFKLVSLPQQLLQYQHVCKTEQTQRFREGQVTFTCKGRRSATGTHSSFIPKLNVNVAPFGSRKPPALTLRLWHVSRGRRGFLESGRWRR